MESSGAGQHEGDIIPHQDAVEQVVDEQLQRTSTHAAIADLPAAANAAYVQAEQTAQNTAINGILAVLRDAGLIPAA